MDKLTVLQADVGRNIVSRYPLPVSPGPYVLGEQGWSYSASVPVRHLPGKNRAMMLSTCVFIHEDRRASFAPMYFIFDGGTKPKPTQLVFGHPFGDYLFGYAIHDHEWRLIWDAWYRSQISTRERRKLLKQSDQNFRDIHRVIKREFLGKSGHLIERTKNRLKYHGVRVYAGLKGIFARRKKNA